MPDRTASSPKGWLTGAQRSEELLERVFPTAENLATLAPSLTPAFFFVTVDGRSGWVPFNTEEKRGATELEFSYRLRAFCVRSGVKGCALLLVKDAVPLPDDGELPNAAPSSPGRTKVVMLLAEFLHSPACGRVWGINRKVKPPRLEDLEMGEMLWCQGPYANLLGQGAELGYPVADDELDRIVACVRRKIQRNPDSGILSACRGRTAGEIIYGTTEGDCYYRYVVGGETVRLVSLSSGEVLAKAGREDFLRQLDEGVR